VPKKLKKLMIHLFTMDSRPIGLLYFQLNLSLYHAKVTMLYFVLSVKPDIHRCEGLRTGESGPGGLFYDSTTFFYGFGAGLHNLNCL